MRHLNQQNNPEELLLNREVIISQKLDGATFGVKKQNNKFNYFGREGKKPLSREKLMTLDIYNSIIEFVESSLEMEDGDYILGELFSEFIKPIIPVTNPPKNELIVFKTNMNLKYLSQFFKVNLPMFEGTLEPDEISTLIELSTSKMTNEEWTRRILEIINSNYIPLVNQREIEGIVIKIKDTDEQYKIVNPSFTDIIMQKKDISKQTFNKKELYDEFNEVIFNQFLSQFNPTHNIEENIFNFFEELITFLRTLGFQNEESIGHMVLNSNMMSNYRGVDLSDIYLQVKGTKLESALWFIFNAIYIERKRATQFFGKDIVNSINKLREIFGISEDDVRIEKIQRKFIEKRIFKIVQR